MKSFRSFAATNLLSAGLLLVPAGLALPALAQSTGSTTQTDPAQQDTAAQPNNTAQTSPTQTQNSTGEQPYQGQDHDNIQTGTSAGKEPTKTQYTERQLVTSTVHQAWLLSGKNEANFLEMVEQIADISQHNRGVKLPDTAEAGRKMGEYIKMRSRQDTDELLYAIVDKAVLNATTDAPRHAGAKTMHPGTAQHPQVGAHTGITPQ
jgi:hypothetical protein